MQEVLQQLLTNLDEAYEKKAWHGPNLRGSLRGITAAEALKRPGKGRHSIWELALHAAYWKYDVRRRLTGIPRGSFALKGRNWFPSPARADEPEWRDVLRLLDAEHRALRDAIAAITDDDLHNPKKLRVIRGAAAHDVYHAGQIGLVMRMIR
jgi:uncharacterized damage-inducible protein DinB